MRLWGHAMQSNYYNKNTRRFTYIASFLDLTTQKSRAESDIRAIADLVYHDAPPPPRPDELPPDRDDDDDDG